LFSYNISIASESCGHGGAQSTSPEIFANNDAMAVHQVVCRYALNTKPHGQFVFPPKPIKILSPCYLMRSQEIQQPGLIIVKAYADDRKALCMTILIDANDIGHLLTTGPAPSRPKINQRDLAKACRGGYPGLIEIRKPLAYFQAFRDDLVQLGSGPRRRERIRKIPRYLFPNGLRLILVMQTVGINVGV
jgi:hypothetical protein